MKRRFSLLILILLLSVGACSKDDSTENSATLNTIANRQQTGSSANDLLSDKKFKSMVIEVVYVTGFEPSTTAIDNFVNFLTARTYKPNGISVVKHAISSPGNSPYTDQEIVNIENANRTKYNNSDQIAVWTANLLRILKLHLFLEQRTEIPLLLFSNRLFSNLATVRLNPAEVCWRPP
jgi:hypothetical protein